MSNLVLDTNAVIFLITKGSIISSDLELELNQAELFMSVISEIELFSKPMLPLHEEKSLRAFLSDRIFIVDLTTAVKKETVALRRTTRLKLPDCIVAATAVVQNAVLLTADKELLALSWPGLYMQSLC